MSKAWIPEPTPRWDASKQALIGAIPAGSLALEAPQKGGLLPGDWFRVEWNGDVVGYAWLETTWGDAEIMMAVHPEHQGHGVGGYMVEQLEGEARKRGLHYLFNVVPGGHPKPTEVTAWLQAHGFAPTDEGQLRRQVN